MWHRKIRTRLNRTSSHRKALMINMVKSFIVHGSITTTHHKAKELGKFVERLISISEEDTLANRRLVIRRLGIHFNTLSKRRPKNLDRLVVGKLFEDAAKFKERNGGYTRVIKVGRRVGDGARISKISYVE